MSTYSDDDRNQHRRRRRVRRPVYEEDVYESSRGGARGPPSRAMELVRANSDDSDVEEIRRDFAPGEGVYVKRRYYADAPSYGGDTRSEGGERRRRRRRRRSDERRRDQSDSDADSESDKSPPRRERRKSFVESALAGLGLGGAAAALTGKKRDDSPSTNNRRGRDRSASSDGSNRSVRSTRSKRSTSKERREKFAQAAKSALAAGVIEAWRSRKEPGGLGGAGKRIATAAIGAAGINGLLDANSHNPQSNGMLKVIESTVGGLAGNRLINGPRSKSRGRDNSNSRSPNGRREKEGKTGTGGAVTGVAAASALAAIGWQAYTTYAKRKNGQHASDDEDSDRGRGSGGGGRARSKSISDRFKGMLGIRGDDNNNNNPYQNGNGQSRPRGGGYEENDEQNRGHESDSSSSGIHTDTYSSDEEKKKCKKMHTKQFIIAGLATAATIHAASSVYKSVEARRVRRKKVAQGKMSPEEAQRLKSRAVLQDAASIGLAAIGIKSAYSEWREMMEQRKELREHQATLQEKHEHRLAKMQRGEWSPSRKNGHGGSDNGQGQGQQGRIEYGQGQGGGGQGRGYANAPVRYTDGNPYGNY